MTAGAMTALAAAAVALALSLPAAAAPASGTLTVCSASGNPPITIALTFTLAAPAGAGGTLVQTAGVGGCSAKIFYPVGTQVIVTENVPTGFAVTDIKLASGSESTIGQTVLGAGVTTVTIGNGDAVVTYTTKGPGAPSARACVVPQVIGLTLAAARKAISRAACRVGTVRYVYSSRIPKGGVTSVSPRRGAHLAHNAKVSLVVSRGPKP